MESFDIVSFLLTFILMTVGIVIAAVSALFLYSLGLVIYKTYVKKDVKYIKTSDLTEEQKAAILETLAQDDNNWINLHVEKQNDMIYFYDGDDPDTAKFLFQCKTYEEMVENLNQIRGHRGVRVPAELVVKMQMEDFFIKPGVKLSSRSVKNESV